MNLFLFIFATGATLSLLQSL